MDLLAKIAEARIQDALARGELDDLPGKGKPLPLEDLSRVPGEVRVGYLLLRNAGVLPEEMELRKEMVTLEALIDACHDAEDRTRLRKDLNARWIRYRILMERRGTSGACAEYRGKLLARLTR